MFGCAGKRAIGNVAQEFSRNFRTKKDSTVNDPLLLVSYNERYKKGNINFLNKYVAIVSREIGQT